MGVPLGVGLNVCPVSAWTMPWEVWKIKPTVLKGVSGLCPGRKVCEKKNCFYLVPFPGEA